MGLGLPAIGLLIVDFILSDINFLSMSVPLFLLLLALFCYELIIDRSKYETATEEIKQYLIDNHNSDILQKMDREVSARVTQWGAGVAAVVILYVIATGALCEKSAVMI